MDADGWLGDLLSGQADRRLAPMTAPDGFDGTLRPYRERGLSWLSFLGGIGLGGILADDMGPGKTIQLLSLIAAQPPGSGPTLLVCPMSLVGNWQREAARFTPDLRVHVHHGADRLDGEDLAAALAGAGLVTTSYGVATRDQAALSTVSWAPPPARRPPHLFLPPGPAAVGRSVLDVTGRPLSEELESFWSSGLTPARLRALTSAPAPATPDLLPRMFPPPPVPVRGQDLADVLASAYQAFAAGEDGAENGRSFRTASALGLPAAVVDDLVSGRRSGLAMGRSGRPGTPRR